MTYRGVPPSEISNTRRRFQYVGDADRSAKKRMAFNDSKSKAIIFKIHKQSFGASATLIGLRTQKMTVKDPRRAERCGSQLMTKNPSHRSNKLLSIHRYRSVPTYWLHCNGSPKTDPLHQPLYIVFVTSVPLHKFYCIGPQSSVPSRSYQIGSVTSFPIHRFHYIGCTTSLLLHRFRYFGCITSLLWHRFHHVGKADPSAEESGKHSIQS